MFWMERHSTSPPCGNLVDGLLSAFIYSNTLRHSGEHTNHSNKYLDSRENAGHMTAEDFYVNLQLLTKGMSNKVWYKYVVAPSDTNTEGGCSEYRDIEYHNKSMRDLHSKFPQYVILKEKKQKSGPWKDMTKLI